MTVRWHVFLCSRPTGHVPHDDFFKPLLDGVVLHENVIITENVMTMQEEQLQQWAQAHRHQNSKRHAEFYGVPACHVYNWNPAPAGNALLDSCQKKRCPSRVPRNNTLSISTALHTCAG